MSVTVAKVSTTPDEAAGRMPRIVHTRHRPPVMLYLSVTWMALIIGAAVFAPLLPIPGYAVPVAEPRTAPSFGRLDLLLGTDNLGRSILSRVVYGARVSLLVGAAAGTVGLVIGSVVGMIGGYIRGKTDSFIGLIVDTLLAFPPLVLLMALASVLTPSIRTLLVGMTIMVVPNFVRLGRSATIAVASREFVQAAVNMGGSRTRILLREVVPNVVAPILAFLPVVMAALIVAEGSLSFLGLGIPPPQPSWGGSIAEGKDALGTDPYLVAVPSMAVFLSVFSLNQLGDFLRAKYDRLARR